MKGKERIKNILLDAVFLILGSAIFAISVSVFTAPNNIAPGGVTGVATLINFIFGTPIGILSFLINVPIFIWAILEIGFKMVLKSLIAVVISSVFIDLFSGLLPAYHGDMILVSIFGGALEGLGLALTFVRGATTGGTDMLARVLGLRFPHLSMGKLMLILDGVIVVISAFVYRRIENAMYACIVIFVSTKIIDTILYGIDAGTGRLFFVMSPKVREMGDRIIKDMDRTVTYLDSKGGYSQIPGETLLCVVRRFEVYQIQNIIRDVDRSAFVIVGDAGDITGEGFRPIHPDDRSLKELIGEAQKKRGKSSD